MVPVHLLVLIHGLWGSPDHLNQISRVIQDKNEQKKSTMDDNIDFHVIIARSNSFTLTYDGVDYCSERVYNEILEEIRKLEKGGRTVTRLSICGYSFGGLIARYLVGILYQRNFFQAVIPVNFVTFACPHVGLTRYPTVVSKVVLFLGPKLLARTGEQFLLADKWGSTGCPLLLVMADPGLLQFQHLRDYANGISDQFVPYLSGGIELEDPYFDYPANGAKAIMHDKYPYLLVDYIVPGVAPPPPKKPIMFSLKWFKSIRFPPMPSALKTRFPFSIIKFVMISLPIVLPILLTYRILISIGESRNSHRRVKVFEDSESYKDMLIYVLAELEQKIDGPGSIVEIAEHQSTSQPSGVETSTSGGKLKRPILTETQKEIVRKLNALQPKLKKETAFFEKLSDAHHAIVCRDADRHELGSIGMGILQHYADNFIF